ncbi:MAG: response regulator [Actinomycetota bacterium]|nr:response regulator [Actinomycetota bacterium]
MRSLQVLVADDNEDHLFLVVRALQEVDGVRLAVEAVRDGEEALDYVYRRGVFEGRPRPQLILLDLKMPKVTGLEVLEQLKNDPELKAIPIVVFTSSERQQDVDAAYEAGTNSYVIKPSAPGGLREGLEELSEYWGQISQLPSEPK